jgi:uncharacterized protein (DUF2267 family)
MDWTGLDVFDASIATTNLWLKEFMQELNSTDRRRSFGALIEVLHAVRNHLTVKDAIRFGDQLPLLIRGAYYEDWQPTDEPAAWNCPSEVHIIRAVFRVLRRKAELGEIRSVDGILPQDLQKFWPPALRAA